MTDPIRHAAETTAGAVVASSWFWVHTLNEVLAALASLVGLVYMLLKIWQVIRELRRPPGRIEPLRAVLLPWAVAMLLAAWPARAHDDDPVLRELQVPRTGGSCYNMTDCALTDDWEQHGTSFLIRIDGKWTPVPDEIVIRNHAPHPTGRAVLCALPGALLCFLPGAQRV